MLPMCIFKHPPSTLPYTYILLPPSDIAKGTAWKTVIKEHFHFPIPPPLTVCFITVFWFCATSVSRALKHCHWLPADTYITCVPVPPQLIGEPDQFLSLIIQSFPFCNLLWKPRLSELWISYFSAVQTASESPGRPGEIGLSLENRPLSHPKFISLHGAQKGLPDSHKHFKSTARYQKWER